MGSKKLGKENRRTKKHRETQEQSQSEKEIVSQTEQEIVEEQEEMMEEREEKRPVKKTKKKLSKKSIILAVGVFLSLVLLVTGYFLRPYISLTKGKNVTLEVHKKYKEAGYQAKFLGNDYKTKVKVTGKVNKDKLGVYDITYSYTLGFLKIKETRHVSVVDRKKPTLTLKGGENSYVCPKKDYKEEGYVAKDNYDGDLTKKVKVSKPDSKGVITYSVKDSSGNETVVKRKIKEKDVVEPVITLEKDELMYLLVGSTFEDPGAKAMDNCDGDISDQITVENQVDTSQAGTYKVIYTVKDKEGNEAKKERTVTVYHPRRAASYGGKAGYIYLTFDDGPSWNTTPTILDILKEEGVKATFFVIYHEGCDDILRRIVNEGHTIALHSYTHDYAIYSSQEAYFNDLESIKNHVKNVTGVESHIIRFPGGSSNTVSRHYRNGIMSELTNEVINRGYKYYDWNISSGDAGNTTSPAGVYQNVVGNLSLERVNMVLMHDIKPYTRDAVRDIVRYGKEHGYTFDRIEDSTEMVTQRVAN